MSGREFLRPLLRWALLPTPTSLRIAAERCPRPLAAALGLLCVPIVLCAVGGVVLAGVNEPFGTFAIYLDTLRRTVLSIATAAAVLWLGVSLALAGGLTSRRLDERRIACAWLLGPLPLLLPALVWAAAFAIVDIPNVVVSTGGVPGWIDRWSDAPALRLLHSCWWIWAMLLWGAFAVVRGVMLLGRSDPAVCAECGYSLAGNVSGICPECGEGVTR